MAAKVWLALAIEFLVFAALLFGGAGTLRWPAGWAFLAILFFAGVAICWQLLRRDPDLLAERMKWPLQKDQPLWDKIFVLPLIAAWCGWLALMGADAVRFHWSAMPAGLQWLGGAFFSLSLWMMARVLRENTFAAAVVRIQTERRHHVITTGPYAIVRHPYYAASLIFFPANSLLLGSYWGLAASFIFCAALVFRTAMEDRELRRGLEGYSEYAERVRWRLAPFVW